MSSLQEAQNRMDGASRPVQAQWDGCSWYGGAQGLSGCYSVEKMELARREWRGERDERRGKD
jgi:hypothetical protein